MENIQDIYISLSKGDAFTISVIVAIAIILVTLLYITCRPTNSRRCILLAGICDSGKTVLFSRLMKKGFTSTYTSIKENSGAYTPTNKKGELGIVDVPGHERLRQECLDRHKAKTRAIIFVVDSSTIQKEIKDVSEYLFTLLTNKTIHQNNPALLVACNKSDMALAKSPKVIQTMLEKEITTLRVTQSAQLDSTTEVTTNTIFIGKRNGTFAFKDLKIKVEFCECSARGNKDGEQENIVAVQNWLSTVS